MSQSKFLCLSSIFLKKKLTKLNEKIIKQKDYIKYLEVAIDFILISRNTFTSEAKKSRGALGS